MDRPSPIAETLLAAALTAMPEPTAVVDSSLSILFANAAWQAKGAGALPAKAEAPLAPPPPPQVYTRPKSVAEVRQRLDDLAFQARPPPPHRLLPHPATALRGG